MADIPVPGRPGETIEALTDDEVNDVIANASDSDDYFPTSWLYALACEVKMLREAAPSATDRAALSTAAFELKGRRREHEARLKRAELLHGEQFDGIDQDVIEAYRDSVKACDAAIEAVERLGGTK